MLLGDKIKKARLKRKLTQTQLAMRVGVGRLHITKLELNYELPSLACLQKICDVLSMKELQCAIKTILY